MSCRFVQYEDGTGGEYITNAYKQYASPWRKKLIYYKLVLHKYRKAQERRNVRNSPIVALNLQFLAHRGELNKTKKMEKATLLVLRPKDVSTGETKPFLECIF